MVVVKFFFAVSTVVEVFADSALIADSEDRRLATAVTGNTNMNYLLRGLFFRFFGVRDTEANAFVFQKFIEDDAGLFFKFLLHQRLEGFAG